MLHKPGCCSWLSSSSAAAIRQAQDCLQGTLWPLSVQSAASWLYPAAFQAVKEKVVDQGKFLADGRINPLAAMSDFELAVIDDILIVSESPEEHIKHVQTVMSVLRQRRMLIHKALVGRLVNTSLNIQTD